MVEANQSLQDLLSASLKGSSSAFMQGLDLARSWMKMAEDRNMSVSELRAFMDEAIKTFQIMQENKPQGFVGQKKDSP